MHDYTFGVFTLTTAHPASHYGIPVLLDETGHAFGPAENVDVPETQAIFGPEPYTAAQLVYWLARNAERGQQDPLPVGVYDCIRLYLSQWPDGPQL